MKKPVFFEKTGLGSFQYLVNKPIHYSCRKASIGSSLDARQAGYKPKATPTVTETIKEKKMAGTWSFVGV